MPLKRYFGGDNDRYCLQRLNFGSKILPCLFTLLLQVSACWSSSKENFDSYGPVITGSGNKSDSSVETSSIL